MKLGPPTDFPDGMKFLPDERLFVFREGKTFHAISAVCTHLGCTVRAEALPQPETMEVGGAPMRVTHRFACPCHGSKYTGDGRVVSGPAPKALAWYHLEVSTDDAANVGGNSQIAIFSDCVRWELGCAEDGGAVLGGLVADRPARRHAARLALSRGAGRGRR